MHVRFTQLKERASDGSWFAKALLCAASVVKTDSVQSRAATSHVYERYSVSISVATNGPFW